MIVERYGMGANEQNGAVVDPDLAQASLEIAQEQGNLDLVSRVKEEISKGTPDLLLFISNAIGAGKAVRERAEYIRLARAQDTTARYFTLPQSKSR
jgi:hypothetical protein